MRESGREGECQGGRERDTYTHGLLDRDTEHGRVMEEGGRERGREAERQKREVEFSCDRKFNSIAVTYTLVHEYMCISSQFSLMCVSSSPSGKFAARCEVLGAYACVTHVQHTHAYVSICCIAGKSTYGSPTSR